MTREEAIKQLKGMVVGAEWLSEYMVEALDMAIKALEQEPSSDLISRDELLKAMDTWDKFGVDDTNSLFRLDNLSLPHYVPYIHYDDVVKCIKGMPSVNPVPSGDLISRQAVIDACEQSINILEAVDRIMDLPSVEQEPKTGHWIDDEFGSKCSCCGIHTHLNKFDKPMKFKYCSMCGAKMESEDKV